MKIYLASDHAGFSLKKEIAAYLYKQGYEIEDCGDYAEDNNDDYPDFISVAAKKVSENPDSKAIVFGKSGSGEEIVANKFKNVRAILGFSAENVKLARQDNDANLLALGSQFVDEQKAIELVKVFLETPFSNEERHKRRIDKIKEIENG
ncbi:MAG: ribose-5-phosphate isomerase [Candidatus Levybacteria bacterium RIFCSPHIGHO2_01_FULL_37_17]|nr:MAG: ribose-5-phosphate isomerase [Candidatus Levybacteria bacterium RIFCSPHIGHO2_01_FULL_37_17]OGH36465.1 MAG: ribose-5-phosphate isomerase [Candidatus Levybacteria bacterium RIFCSPLOWO2_01_FULL_38_23]